MDIRDIDGLWCDDITFCQEKCSWMSCPRNKQNIRDRTIPHSFSVEIPQDCPKKQNGGEVGMTLEEAYQMGYRCATIIKPGIVRCKDCKHRSNEMYDYYDNPNNKVYVCQIHDLANKPDWFCADGERREADGV